MLFDVSVKLSGEYTLTLNADNAPDAIVKATAAIAKSDETKDKSIIPDTWKINPVGQTGKTFKVASISQNRGAFGHNAFILIAKDGEAWEALHIQGGGHEVWEKGQEITVSGSFPKYNWAAIGVEVPSQLKTAPKGVVDEIWK